MLQATECLINLCLAIQLEFQSKGTITMLKETKAGLELII